MRRLSAGLARLTRQQVKNAGRVRTRAGHELVAGVYVLCAVCKVQQQDNGHQKMKDGKDEEGWGGAVGTLYICTA